MLQELKWTTLEERRKRAKVIMLYRTIHLTVLIPYQPYLIPGATHHPPEDMTTGSKFHFLDCSATSSLSFLNNSTLEQHPSSNCRGIHH
jgi:hypothetical protein